VGAAGRLKVLWANVNAWRADEQHWKDLRDASDHIRDTPEDHALWMVVDNLREWDLATALYNKDSGILLIPDVDALAADLDLDRDFLTSERASFVDWRSADPTCAPCQPTSATNLCATR
jgi:hypothetical protein